MDFQNWIRSYVIQVIPLISLILYIMGFCYYIAYYAVFGINILSYITLSEVLVTALIPITLCIVLGLFYILLYRVSFYVVICRLNKNRRLKSYFNKIKEVISRKGIVNKSFKEKLEIKLYSILVFMVSIILLILLLDCDIYSKRLVLLSCSIMLISVTYDNIRFYSRIRFKKIRQIYCELTYALVGVGLVFSLAVLGVIEGKNIQLEKPQYFELVLTDGGMFTSQDYIYLGDTTTAVFIYEIKTSRSLIINKEQVISIAMKPEYNADQLLLEGPKPFKYSPKKILKD